MSADQIDKLYQYYDVLNAASDKKLVRKNFFVAIACFQSIIFLSARA
jgi:hypothetical protein